MTTENDTVTVCFTIGKVGNVYRAQFSQRTTPTSPAGEGLTILSAIENLIAGQDDATIPNVSIPPMWEPGKVGNRELARYRYSDNPNNKEAAEVEIRRRITASGEHTTKGPAEVIYIDPAGSLAYQQLHPGGSYTGLHMPFNVGIYD
jgi:hypothetical protein